MREDMTSLEKLVESYPYFGLGHILYLNGLKKFDSDKFNLQLNKSAVRIADRGVIYQMVKHSRAVAKENENRLKEQFKEPLERPTAEYKQAEVPVEPQVVATKPQVIKDELPVIEEKPQVVEVKPSLASLDDIFAGVHEDFETLEDTGISEFFSETTDANSPEEEMSMEKSVDIPEAEYQVADYFVEEIDEKPSIQSVEEPTIPSNKMNLGSFNSWLKEQLKEKNLPKKTETVSEQAIIDKFIQTEPKISKPKAEFFNPVEASKRSVVDDESIVSETLAKIYAEQGDYDKAISAYKKLSLEKPEKSTYFAALIYELELKQSLE